jgi:hypothetical protein
MCEALERGRGRKERREREREGGREEGRKTLNELPRCG